MFRTRFQGTGQGQQFAVSQPGPARTRLRARFNPGKRNIVLRSESGDPARVTLRGGGWENSPEGDGLIHIGHCEGVTIAHLTFADCCSYGVKVEAERAPKDIHNSGGEWEFLIFPDGETAQRFFRVRQLPQTG